MITIPLADVVAFFNRHKVALDVLEGAPIAYPERDDQLWYRSVCGIGSVHASKMLLYLGTDKVCPAAMGWASSVLSAARGWPLPLAIDVASDRPIVRSYAIMGWAEDTENHIWGWGDALVSGESVRVSVIEDEVPLTPAARLKAVLLYEMGRA